MSKKKAFFAKHAKSSAALVSLGIHAVIILVALSFVAVTVITKNDQNFEAKPVKRPKMALKKLQVPVNIKKKKMQKPKLRKRIVVQPKVAKMPDIKMPEISGVKGGLGGGTAGGLGGAGSLGFSMPEFEIFGIKGKGEKVFLVLDSSDGMMFDEMGGIPAYTIIKEELIRIVDELPSTALFNVAVFDRQNFTLFPQMVSASSSNKAKLKAWLEPLNAVSQGMGKNDYGVKTLGTGGIEHKEQALAGIFEEKGEIPSDAAWPRSTMLAMEAQADTVFLLTCKWGNLGAGGQVDPREMEAWNKSSDKKKYDKNLATAKLKLEEENKARAAKGQPPRVLSGGKALLDAYFPGTPLPPQGKGTYIYTPKDFAEAFVELQTRNRTASTPVKSGLSNRKKKSSKPDFSFNVIHFVKKSEENVGRAPRNFTALAKMCNGEYRTIAGMAAIESYLKVSSSE